MLLYITNCTYRHSAELWLWFCSSPGQSQWLRCSPSGDVTCLLPNPCRVMSRLAVVCGGSRGIGKAASRLLAERGCRLVVLSRDEGAARAAAASLPGGTYEHCPGGSVFSCSVSYMIHGACSCLNVCLFVPPADHMALSCDVSKEQEVQKTFETIQKNCGNITYLVNSAGINRCVFHTLAWL